MQDMSMQEGSTLRVYFLGPESPIINRPLSAEEKSLTIKFPSNPTGNSASNIGISGEDNTSIISENPSVMQREKGEQHVTSMMTFENKVLQ